MLTCTSPQLPTHFMDKQLFKEVLSVDVPELRGMNGSSKMDGLERFLRLSEHKDVKAVLSKKRTLEAKMEADIIKKNYKNVDGLGELKAVIPARDFFRWQQDQGSEVWSDSHFRKSFYRDNPDMVVK